MGRGAETFNCSVVAKFRVIPRPCGYLSWLEARKVIGDRWLDPDAPHRGTPRDESKRLIRALGGKLNFQNRSKAHQDGEASSGLAIHLLER